MDEMDRIFSSALTGNEMKLEPVTEIAESDDDFVLRLDLPGVKIEDIQIEALQDRLTVTGERKDQWRSDKHSPVQREGQSRRVFHSQFKLPNSVDATKIQARFEDGVLQLSLPKSPAAQARRIEVQAGSSPVTHELKNLSQSETAS
jgi:HSP20 family protein